MMIQNQFLHSLPSKINWDADDSLPVMDDYPAPRPKPMVSSAPHLGNLRSLLTDPTLCITPEKRATSLLSTNTARLRASTDDEDERTLNSLRQTRVRFDQNVEVHHLSPEFASDASGASPPEQAVSVEQDSPMLSLRANISDLSPHISPSAERTSDGRPSGTAVIAPVANIPTLHSSSSTEVTSTVPKAYFSSPVKQEKLDTFPIFKGAKSQIDSLTGRASTLGLDDDDADDDLDITASSNCDPISIFASDMSGSLDTMPKGHGGTGKKNVSAVSSNKPPSPAIKLNSREQTFQESSSSSKLSMPDNMLARPEFNSTLKVSKEIAQLKEKEFDATDVLKEKIDPKLKATIDEKASVKLNRDNIQFPELISLDVRPDEVLTRVSEERGSRVRLEPTTEKLRPEGSLAAPPDLMELFTSDLQRETASHSLVGLPALRRTLCTADTEHAFDVYRHIRAWEGCP